MENKYIYKVIYQRVSDKVESKVLDTNEFDTNVNPYMWLDALNNKWKGSGYYKIVEVIIN